jgi:hypothetical protein
MSVKLTNLSGSDLEIDDGKGGRLKILAGETETYPGDIATAELARLIQAQALRVEDEPKPDDDDEVDDDC